MSSDTESVGSSTRTFSPNPNQGAVPNYQTATASDPPLPNQRRSFENDDCYCCKQKGHWARDCHLKSQKKSQRLETSSSTIDDSDFPQKQCPCGEGACVILTSKTLTNPGRKFYKCYRCGFFKWCDNVSFDQRSDVPMPPYPMCSCGAGKCCLLTTKNEKNAGRKYFVCPVKKGQGACNFFQWQDCPGKDQDPIDNCSDESLYLSYSESLSDNEKDTNAATDSKQAEGDGCKPEIVLSNLNLSNESRSSSSLCGERSQVEEEMGHHPLIKSLALLEGAKGNGNGPEGMLLHGFTDKGPLSSSGEVFRLEEVGHHQPSKVLGLHTEGLAGDGNGLDGASFNASNGKGSLPLPSTGSEVDKVGHHLQIEELGSQGETTNSVVAQPKKCFQSGEQRHWMKEGSRSRWSICSKCGKFGHPKKDCSN